MDKAQLLTLVLDVIAATERAAPLGAAEYEFVHDLELTADALLRFAEAKRNVLDGLPSDSPVEILERHSTVLKLRNQSHKETA